MQDRRSESDLTRTLQKPNTQWNLWPKSSFFARRDPAAGKSSVRNSEQVPKRESPPSQNGGGIESPTAQVTGQKAVPDPKNFARLSILNSAIGDFESLVDDRESLAQLLLVDAERRIGEECIPTDERVESLLAEELSQRRHLFGSPVEWRHGLACFAVAYELENAEQSDRAYSAN
jgi:hypothetical protein